MKIFTKILGALLFFGTIMVSRIEANPRDDSVHFSWADVLRVDPVFEYQAVSPEECRQATGRDTVENACRRNPAGGYEQRHIIGYDVEYRYRGEIYMARTSTDPGDRLRVRVSVTPAE